MWPLLLLLGAGGAAAAFVLLRKPAAPAPVVQVQPQLPPPPQPQQPPAPYYPPIPPAGVYPDPRPPAPQVGPVIVPVQPPPAPAMPDAIVQAALAASIAVLADPNWSTSVGISGTPVNTAVHNFKAVWNASQSPKVPIGTGKLEPSVIAAITTALGARATSLWASFSSAHTGGYVMTSGWMIPMGGFAHTGANITWKKLAKAPRAFRETAIAVAKAMANDNSVPLGLSEHTINGVRVKVHKPDRGHLQILGYAAGK